MNPTLPPFVQELFDRGIDPLDDPRTAEWLLANPTALDPFATLRAELSRLPQQRPAHRRRPLPWLMAAAAGLALWAVVTYSRSVPAAGETARTTPARTAPTPQPDFATTGDVVFCRVVTTERAGLATRQHIEQFARSAGDDGGPALGERARIELSTTAALAGPSATWTITRIADERALLP
ncbi:MAG: hypothetical protein KDE27_22170 [Planctomycetes bacterium]|nr:hypothetical protein [Planctomycetota bacterium]